MTVLVLLCVFGQGVRSQIEDVRAGMLENVDKVLERGEKIEVRALSTSHLSVAKGLTGLMSCALFLFDFFLASQAVFSSGKTCRVKNACVD